MLWARKHIGTEIDEPHWKYAEGATFQSFGDPNESDEILELALDAFRTAQDLLPDIHSIWPIPGYMADVHFERKEYTEALENNLKCRELKSGVVGTGRTPLEEQGYLEEYWNSYLRDADCYKELGDFEVAATSYQTVMKGDFFWDRARARDMHEVAAGSLFAQWNDKQDHASILEMMQAWRQAEDGTNGIKYWLLKMGSNKDFHSHIRSATMRTGQHQEVIEMYRYVLDQASDAPEDDNFNELYHYYALILYYASPNEEDHDAAIECWRDLLSTLRAQEGSTSSINFDALPAIVQRSLCKALIERAVSKTAGHSSEEVAKYTSHLRALVTEDDYSLPQLRNTPQDPRIALARLLTMQSKSEEAYSVAETMIRNIFEKWPDLEDEAAESYMAIGCLLSVIEDNDNAIAACSMGTDLVTCQSCSEHWPYVTIFLCKQCLALRLCTDCHAKLLSDALAPEICSKKHSFLEIPDSDSSKEEEVEDDMIKVGKSVLTRKDWLDGLRHRWNVTEEQLARRKAEEEAEARASEVIGRRVSKWWKKSRK